MECKNCGKKLYKTHKFCPECGTKVGDMTDEVSVDNEAEVSADEKKANLINELEKMSKSLDESKVDAQNNADKQLNVEDSKAGNFALTGFVLSLCGLLGNFIGFVTGILGIIFASLSIKATKAEHMPKNKFAVAGLAIGITVVSLFVLRYNYCLIF